jgi:hypothetical protein
MELIAGASFLVGLWRKQSWAIGFAQANLQKVLGYFGLRSGSSGMAP